jgi:hypothetical protein
MHAGSKTDAGAAFAKFILDKPQRQDAKTRKAATDKRKETAAAVATT